MSDGVAALPNADNGGFEPFRSVIAGEVCEGVVHAVVNPATGGPFAAYHAADGAALDRAVEAAHAAAIIWRDTPLCVRRQLLRQMAGTLHDHAESLANLLTLEQGKPLSEARQEVLGSVGILLHYASLHEAKGGALLEDRQLSHLRTYRPLGVVAGIIPWNFPLLIAVMKAAPALLTGNAIIIKPAPTTPATTLEFARLAAAGCPPGLFQVLGDDGTLGSLMTAHTGIRKISFTGSTESGRRVMAASAPTLKRLTLELGGNDAAIILDDVDIEETAGAVFRGAFTNCGQVCGAIKRIYVATEIKDRFCAALARLADGVVVGDGLAPATTLGPVQNRTQHTRALELLASARTRGQVVAEVLAPDGPGFFVPLTVLTDLPDDHPLVREEQFAPLLPVLGFETEAEAVKRANCSPYGLTASVWSSDRTHARAVARQMDAGLVCINAHNECPLTVGIPMAKASGAGWLLGDEGLQEYLQGHTIVG